MKLKHALYELYSEAFLIDFAKFCLEFSAHSCDLSCCISGIYCIIVTSCCIIFTVLFIVKISHNLLLLFFIVTLRAVSSS